MRVLPKFLITENENTIFIIHAQKPRMICKLIQVNGQPKNVEVVEFWDDEPEPKRLDGLLKRMFEWYIYKIHNESKAIRSE